MFSGNYDRHRKHNVRVHALRSHQNNNIHHLKANKLDQLIVCLVTITSVNYLKFKDLLLHIIRRLFYVSLSETTERKLIHNCKNSY